MHAKRWSEMVTRFVSVAVVSVSCVVMLSGCATSVEEGMGPQVFQEPNVSAAGGTDKDIQSAVETAVNVAQSLQFHYDASSSANGRVVVTALWKNRPVTLTMRFFRKDGSVYIASSLTQPGDVFEGEKIERLFYSRLAEEAGRRGLRILGDPSARP